MPEKDEKALEGEGQQSGTPPSFGSWDEVWKVAFEHPRFKELNERAKKAEKAIADREAEAKKEADQKLLEEKKWQELYESQAKKATELEARLQATEAKRLAELKKAAIFRAAQTAGIGQKAAADVHLFVNLDEIKTDEEGNPVSADIEKLVKAVAADRPYLVEKRSDPGSPSGGRKPSSPAPSSGAPTSVLRL